MIGRQGLAYGGHETSESLYNFLGIRVIIMEIEIIKTFSKHNELLQKHLDLAIKKNYREERNETSKGRGGLVTLLSKSFINRIIDAIMSFSNKWDSLW